MLQFCIKDIEGCDTFGPEHIWYPDIWSPSIGPQEQTVPAHLVPKTIGPPGQLVPKHLVPMDNWSPWTNGPQTFGPHGQMVPPKIGPHGQLVPKIY